MDLLDVVKNAGTVALIVFATRWLSTAVSSAKGSDSPRIHGGVTTYNIRWPLRAVAYAGALLFLVPVFVDAVTGGRWPADLLFVAFALGFVLFGTGVVTSDQNSISKKFLWYCSSLKWEEINEVRLHKRDGGAIELRGNGKKLIVDSRFVAQEHLRGEIEQRTKLRPLSD